MILHNRQVTSFRRYLTLSKKQLEKRLEGLEKGGDDYNECVKALGETQELFSLFEGVDFNKRGPLEQTCINFKDY